MPTYNSIGVSASLLVTSLDGTLSDAIDLRMGTTHQVSANRINKRLDSGRALPETPIGSSDSKVGILQLVGEDQDMALFLVEAGDAVAPQTQQGYIAAAPTAGVIEKKSFALTNIDPALMGATTLDPQPPTATEPTYAQLPTALLPDTQPYTDESAPSVDQPAQANPSHRKMSKSKVAKKTNLSRKKSEPATQKPKQPQSFADVADSSGPLALTLKVDCTKFFTIGNKELLGGKDLKIEVYLNGQLVDVSYESQRSGKHGGLFLHSGLRVHRQCEKPWIYAPDTASTNASGESHQRWENINAALKQEASIRGENQWSQRPISAQFLVTLAHLQLPNSVSAKSQNFAVFDVVVTAGKGRKYGPEAGYIIAPKRLDDRRFSGVFSVADDIGPVDDLTGDLTMNDEPMQTYSEDPMYSTFQTPDKSRNNGPAQSYFATSMYSTFQTPEKSTHNEPAQTYSGNPLYPASQTPYFLDSPSGMPTEQQKGPSTPQTPSKTQHKYAAPYRKALDGKLMEKLLSTYQNAHGKTKGQRTLKQRLGDMAKMSPERREAVLNDLAPELDDEMTDAIKEIFDMDVGTPTKTSRAQVSPTTPTRKRVRFDPTIPGSTDAMEDPQKSSLPPFAPLVPKRTSLGAGRTSAQWYPDEVKTEEVLANFQVPDLCVGSAVTYAGGMMQRQVAKARGGEFQEEQFVVGMRFFVL